MSRRRILPLELVVTRVARDTSDAELGRALIAGHPWAVAETWSRFAPPVILMATRALGSESEAEDVAQEAFFRLFAKATTLRDPERLRSFVFSYAIRVLKSELRSKHARAWLSFQRPETLLDMGTELMDVESRDLLRRFYLLLDRLTPRHRLIFVLRNLEAMTLEEISSHMDLSVSTVKRGLNHATNKLERWIGTDSGFRDFLATFANGRASDERSG